MISSGVTGILPPNPPPTSGAMTRTFCSDRPSTTHSMVRRMCGICVADHTVTASPLGCTTVERGLHVDDGRQRFVLDLDRFQRVVRLARGAGGHDGDALAGEVDLVDGECRRTGVDHVRRDRPGT